MGRGGGGAARGFWRGGGGVGGKIVRGGGPPGRFPPGKTRHESIIRAVRLLGIGTAAIELLPCDDLGGIRLEALSASLERSADRPTVGCLQAGDLNTRAFAPLARACALAPAARAPGPVARALCL